MGEASGAEEQSLQDYLLRELISEGRLRYPVVQRMVTVTVEKNGPVAFMVTTTKAALHPENETRMLSLEIDDSETQTRIVLDKVAEIIGLNFEHAVVEFEPWRDYQRWLGAGNCQVVVPFADKLAKLIPPRSVRLRRDFSQLLLGIKAHALLHRRHRLVDDQGQIIANIEQDYATVAELMGGIVAEASGTNIPKGMQETIDAVATATANLAADEGATADKIAKALRLDRSSAWRRLNKAAIRGFIVNLETRKNQPGRYRVIPQEVEVEELLPTVEAFREVGTQPLQPCNRTPFLQAEHRDLGCVTGCAIAQEGKPHTTVQPAPNSQGSEGSWVLPTGCAIAPVASDADPLACLKNNGFGLKPAALSDQAPTIKCADFPPSRGEGDAHTLDAALDDFPELPACLDRRKRSPSIPT